MPVPPNSSRIGQDTSNEQVREDLYRRFSKWGQWRLRFRRFIQGVSLESWRELPLPELRDRLENDLRTWHGEDEFSDDITLMAIEME